MATHKRRRFVGPVKDANRARFRMETRHIRRLSINQIVTNN